LEAIEKRGGLLINFNVERLKDRIKRLILGKVIERRFKNSSRLLFK